MVNPIVSALVGALHHDLHMLKRCTNDILATVDSSMGGAVNWADLCCVSVELYVDDGGDCGYRVYVEEASPDATELRMWLQRRLAESGWDGVEVVLAW